MPEANLKKITALIGGSALALTLFVAAAAGPLEDGGAAYQKGDYAAAMSYWRPLAEQGNASVQFNLGVMYDLGQGVQQDYAQALIWYRKAADNGLLDAQFNIGLMYEQGKGVQQDYAQALDWYRDAADQGLAYAQNKVGAIYDHGQGVQRDYGQAVLWYHKAAEQGDAEAQNNLGLMYEQGKGVQQDYVQALIWYRKAVDQGLADAQNNLGALYANGHGVPKDEAQAFVWCRKAAEQGNADAQNNLGVMYANGLGVPRDDAQASLWYRKAAEQGHAAAQHNLDVMNAEAQVVAPPKDAEQGQTGSPSSASGPCPLISDTRQRLTCYDKAAGVAPASAAPGQAAQTSALISPPTSTEPRSVAANGPISFSDMAAFDRQNQEDMLRYITREAIDDKGNVKTFTDSNGKAITYIPYLPDKMITNISELLQPYFDDLIYQSLSVACNLGPWKDFFQRFPDPLKEPFTRRFFSKLHRLVPDGREEQVAFYHLSKVFYMEHPELPRAYNIDFTFKSPDVFDWNRTVSRREMRDKYMEASLLSYA